MSGAAKNTRERIVDRQQFGPYETVADLRATILDLEALGARLSALESKANPSEPPKSSSAPSGALVERMAAFVEKKLDACFCDDGRGLPECHQCVDARALLAELRKGGGA